MAAAEPSRQTLEEIPSRALAFLRGAGNSPDIRSVLVASGYTAEEHAQGWSLLHATSGFIPDKPTFAVEGDPAVQDAINQLDAWDEPNFARIQAMLERHHPAQDEFLFASLAPAQGAAAVVSVTTLLDRLDALESSPDRKATHKEDLAAIKLLEQRGYTKKMRGDLRALIAKAQQGTDHIKVSAPDPKKEKVRADYEKALKALYAWHKDWSTTARAVIKRRDYLIRLGLAKRKQAAKKNAAPAPDQPR